MGSGNESEILMLMLGLCQFGQGYAHYSPHLIPIRGSADRLMFFYESAIQSRIPFAIDVIRNRRYCIPANISVRDIIANLAPPGSSVSYPARYHCKALDLGKALGAIL